MNGADETATSPNLKSFAIRFLFQHGLWATLTVALIATILGWLPSPQTREIEILKGIILENRATIKDTHRQMEIDHGYQNVLLRTLCRNSMVLQQQGQCEPNYYGYQEKEKPK